MIDVDKLRRDYMLVVGWMVNFGEWSGLEAKEIGEEIRQAVGAQDHGYLAFWADSFGNWVDIGIACGWEGIK